MRTAKLTLHRETLRALQAAEADQVQGAARATKNQYTCNGSVGIACTVLNCITVGARYTCNGSVGKMCTIRNCK